MGAVACRKLKAVWVLLCVQISVSAACSTPTQRERELLFFIGLYSFVTGFVVFQSIPL